MSDPFAPSPELAAIVERWLRNYAERRAAAAAAPLSGSAALSFIGTDETEVLGGEDMRRGFAVFTERHAPLTVEMTGVEAWQAGAFGYARAALSVHQAEADKRVAIRSTFVFALEDGIWRIVHVHNSNPTPNFEAMGYESQSLDDLTAAAQAELLEVGRTGIASIMFTDIVDSTALTEALGDAAWSRIVAAHLESVTEAVREAGGELVKSLGDGTLSSFGSAGAALAAAQAIQRANAARAAEPRLRLRIGLHTGDLVRTDDDYLGGVVNKAARIAAAAGPDEIRVSDATRAMVGGAPGLAFDDPATVALKGLDGEHLILRLFWREPDAPEDRTD